MIKKQSTLRRLPSSVVALGMVSLFMDASSEMIHSILPVFIVTGLGASALTLGLIEGLADAIASLTKVFSGYFSDKFRRRKPLTVVGYALAAVSKIFFPLAQGIGMVMAGRFLDRIGKGVRDAPRDALMADITPKDMHGAAYGLRQALDSTGAVLGPLVGMGLLFLWANNFRAVFWVALIPAFLCILTLVLFVKEKPDGSKAARPPLRWREATQLGPMFWWFLVVVALFAMARFSEAFLVLRLTDTGIASSWAPLAFVLLSLVDAALSYPVGNFSDRVGRSRLLIAGCTVILVANLVLASSSHLGLVLLGIVLWGLHRGLTQGIMSAVVADTAPEHLRGTAFGLYNLTLGLAALPSGLLAGWLWAHEGGGAAYGAGAAFALLALAGFVFWRKRYRIKH